jgi:hypothetical protein
MGRDGVVADYLAYAVPSEVEAGWFDELLQERLSWLTQPGNWRTISFLNLHVRSEYLDEITSAEPMGEWWERCAFLEETLRYVEVTCRRFYPPERLAEVCRSIAEQAAPLAETMPPDQPPNRVTNLVAHASAFAALLSPS